jgi:hypothetical protein
MAKKLDFSSKTLTGIIMGDLKRQGYKVEWYGPKALVKRPCKDFRMSDLRAELENLGYEKDMCTIKKNNFGLGFEIESIAPE